MSADPAALPEVVNGLLYDLDEQARREQQAFRDGADWGYSVGWEIGYSACDGDLADAWAGQVRRVHRLLGPDRPDARVAAADQHARMLAVWQWNNPAAWESAWRSGTYRCPPELRLWQSGADLRADVERQRGHSRVAS